MLYIDFLRDSDARRVSLTFARNLLGPNQPSKRFHLGSTSLRLLQFAYFFARLLTDINIKLSPDSSRDKTPRIVRISTVASKHGELKPGPSHQGRKDLPQIVRVITRQSVRGRGVSIPKKKRVISRQIMSHMTGLQPTENVCRSIIGDIFQLNPMTKEW